MNGQRLERLRISNLGSITCLTAADQQRAGEYCSVWACMLLRITILAIPLAWFQACKFNTHYHLCKTSTHGNKHKSETYIHLFPKRLAGFLIFPIKRKNKELTVKDNLIFHWGQSILYFRSHISEIPNLFSSDIREISTATQWGSPSGAR